MKRLIYLLLALALLNAVPAGASVLAFSANGSYVSAQSLTAALASAAAVGRQITVTSAITGNFTITSPCVLVLNKEATITGNITITSSNVEIIGEGTINGSISIQGTSGTSITNLKIKDVTINQGRPDTGGNNAISLQYASTILIDGVTFQGGDKCVYVIPLNVSGHVSKLIITRCRTRQASSALYTGGELANSYPYTYITAGYPNYFYYVDNPYPNNVGGTEVQTAADTTITENHPVVNSKGNVYALGQDGAVITSNTFYLSGGYYLSQIKNNNIFIENSDWVVISNNELFEAGQSSIKMHWLSDATITGNNIAWPGQRDNVNGYGIHITGGGIAPSGGRYVCSTIADNNIRQPTNSGIQIDANQDIVTIKGNTITTAGNPATYYGDGTQSQGSGVPALSGTRYGINVDATCYGVTVAGNNNPANYNLLPKSTATSLGFVANAGPAISGNQTLESDNNINLSGTTAPGSLPINGALFTSLNYSGGGTVTAITGGNNGQSVSIYNGSTPVTFTNSSSLNLKGGLDYSLPYQSSLTLVLLGGNWFEVGRN